jgi:hypothetical protein
LTKKIHSQPKTSVMKPPRSRPAAPPPAATAVQAATAWSRSRPSVKMVVMIESAAGAVVAAPRPWRARETTSISGETEKPQESEAVVKTASPATKVLLLPHRSDTLPDRSKKPAKNNT